MRRSIQLTNLSINYETGARRRSWKWRIEMGIHTGEITTTLRFNCSQVWEIKSLNIKGNVSLLCLMIPVRIRGSSYYSMCSALGCIKSSVRKAKHPHREYVVSLCCKVYWIMLNNDSIPCKSSLNWICGPMNFLHGFILLALTAEG